MWQSTTWDDYNDAWGAAAVQDPSAAGGTAASIAPASYWCMSLSQEKTNSVEQAQAKKTEAYNTTTKNSLKAFHGVEDEPSYATDMAADFPACVCQQQRDRVRVENVARKSGHR